MKWIKYKILQEQNGDLGETEHGDILLEKAMSYSESNLEVAKQEAYNGKYEIFDDEQPEPEETPSQLDIIEAQVTYTAMMTDTLLEV